MYPQLQREMARLMAEDRIKRAAAMRRATRHHRAGRKEAAPLVPRRGIRSMFRRTAHLLRLRVLGAFSAGR
jgi:hypothetical protein